MKFQSTHEQTQRLARAILIRAHHLDAPALSRLALRVSWPDWASLAPALSFTSLHTGGGMGMLVAAVPGTALWVSITDGEAGFPTTTARFHLGIGSEPGEGGLYGVLVGEGGVLQREEAPL